MNETYGTAFEDGVRYAHEDVSEILEAFERGDIDSFEGLLSILSRWVDGEPYDGP
jgi:hypothetical protein